VDNRTDGVTVLVNGDQKTIDLFRRDLLENAPPASIIKSIEIKPSLLTEFISFKIAGSKAFDNTITEISPDIAVCDDCLEDMKSDPGRIDYPFINCTNCGPRFTIIQALPYDRANTTMKSFRMCGNCSSEYNDILDRRFHAQPVACNSCGPVYRYKDQNRSLDNFKEIIEEIVVRIESGKSVALKGLGGYHLICDALNNIAVSELRQKKQRDGKPFAVMFRDVEMVRKYCYLDEEEEKELLSWRRPILILKHKRVLSYSVSNGLETTGAMLPYMPVHYLLFGSLQTPALILTSGNISDEPIIIDDLLAEEQLRSVADSIVSYNREIFNRADDSVIRFVARQKCIIRRSRGFVPGPVDLFCRAEGILALGAEQKNSICFGKGYQAIMSQYIGDLKDPTTFEFFKDSIEKMSFLLKFKPEVLCCDLHPDYLSTQYAELLRDTIRVPLFRIQHHHAHIASCMAEAGLDEPVIGISLDGTGYGTDCNTWGGEFMIADLNDFSRFSHFAYVPMPGGEKAVYEPWRMALAYIYTSMGENFDCSSVPVFRKMDKKTLSFAIEMIDKKINTPLTSGAGRLFDAVASILGLCKVSTFDSEGPMRLESVADESTNETYPFQLEETISFSETIRAILEDLPKKRISVISSKFHNTVAHVMLDMSRRIRSETSLNKVVLSGGVFQNKYLSEKTIALLSSNNFRVFTNHIVPVNDGGISLGQLVIASKKRESCV
jgi:hydrogenase maturation protein HypF